MVKICIIGSGNVAQHLIAAFLEAEKSGSKIQLLQVYCRHKQSLTKLLPYESLTDNLNALIEADVYVVAISDDAIAEVSGQLPFKNKLVVHTSGSANLESLSDHNRKGVFYPLQSFTKGKDIDFKNIPICLESENPTDYQTLEQLAISISDHIYAINSGQRRALHLAAVFANNFTNHMYALAKDICDESKIPFEILQPLIIETSQKTSTLPPKMAQTGPAIRNDHKTIEEHLQFLQDKNKSNIYKILTQSIQKYGKEL